MLFVLICVCAIDLFGLVCVVVVVLCVRFGILCLFLCVFVCGLFCALMCLLCVCCL